MSRSPGPRCRVDAALVKVSVVDRAGAEGRGPHPPLLGSQGTRGSMASRARRNLTGMLTPSTYPGSHSSLPRPGSPRRMSLPDVPTRQVRGPHSSLPGRQRPGALCSGLTLPLEVPVCLGSQALAPGRGASGHAWEGPEVRQAPSCC